MYTPELSMGWQRDLPDFRDHTKQADDVAKILSKSKRLQAAIKKMPASIDLRQWCSPIEDQGNIGSCTANAGVGLLEYFERRAFGKHLDGSRLFLYKATRNLLGWTGDQGAHLRATMKAMVLFGVPPETHWPYKVTKYDEEPPAFCYAFAQNYKALNYYRLDPPGTSTSQLLTAIKNNLAANLPCMFGFTVYSSIPPSGDGKGEIPYPLKGESVLGGHAIVAVGFNDTKVIGKNKGALLIRNSWGTSWGMQGYGWLPYAYVESGLAVDFWSLVKADYIDTDLFK
ncbi:C1 family peptidase [Sulfurirhabdus autotrophica]|uniref:C1A family cysteine protease n=1 Tax=Sulfurirhabdus autotrophica TaxID=1706046 RepID=A0A4R3YAH0_9PROT|nr:C1 family peptidase [Sulfurirhabdus autotrophica]TCV88997.1 C1A family cysteine protease [Sulfurirhabdus autotrophica]